MYKTNSSPRGSSNFLKRNFLKITLMSLLFLIFSSCSVVPEEAYSTPWNGFTSERPPQVNGVYIITKAEHLSWLSIIIIIETKVRFDANIDMNNKNFAGIKYFKGTMDGNGHSIKNLKMDDPLIKKFGLIHLLAGDGSEIKNLTIENGSIKGEADVGAFVGESQDSVTLSGLINKASVETSISSSAGLVAYANGKVTVNNSQNYGTITGSFITGGILGYSAGITTINNVQNFGVLTGARIGGIVGHTDKLIEIDNAQNFGNITRTTGTTGSAGGVIGYAENNAVTIKNVGNSGKVTGTGNIGGMIGEASTTGTKTIDYAYNYQNMKFIGDGSVTITESYRLNATDEDGVTSLGAGQFRNQGSFKGWDFSTIWKMGNNYPILR